MRPATVNLPDHTHGDKWEGIPNIGPITIDGIPPALSVSTCRIQFRDSATGRLAYELHSSGGAGKGTITIVSAVTWQFLVPAQMLEMDAGTYTWGFQVIDTSGAPFTAYSGSFNLVMAPCRD